MKKKFIFIIGIIILIAAFFIVIEKIKELQQTPLEIIDENSLVKNTDYKTTEVIDFAKILELAGVQGCQGVGIEAAETGVFQEDARFSGQLYEYEQTEVCDEFFDILNSYKYTYSSERVSKISSGCYVRMLMYGTNEYALNIRIGEIEEEGMVWIDFDVEDQDMNLLEGELHATYFNGFLTDSKIVDEIYELISNSTKQASLAEVREIVMDGESEMSRGKLLYFEHGNVENYCNYDTDEWYFITDMKLTDYEGHLKVFYFNLNSGDIAYTTIFKVELYDNSNQLVETLYYDEATYEAHIE